MAATDVPEVPGVPAGLDIEVNLNSLATFGLHLERAATAFGNGSRVAQGVEFDKIQAGATFEEMNHFVQKVNSDVQEMSRFTLAMENGLMSYSSAAIASFNKYGWGDDQARLSLQDVRDAMKAVPKDAKTSTATPAPNATAD